MHLNCAPLRPFLSISTYSEIRLSLSFSLSVFLALCVLERIFLRQFGPSCFVLYIYTLKLKFFFYLLSRRDSVEIEFLNEVHKFSRQTTLALFENEKSEISSVHIYIKKIGRHSPRKYLLCENFFQRQTAVRFCSTNKVSVYMYVKSINKKVRANSRIYFGKKDR